MRTAIAVVTALVAFLLAVACCCNNHFALATPTEPMVVQAKDTLPLRFLVHDAVTKKLSLRLAPPTNPDETVVATFRYGGDDFAASTGWNYLEVASRPESFAKYNAHKHQHHHARRAFSSLESHRAEFRRTILNLKNSSQNYYVDGADHFFYAGFLEGRLGAANGKLEISDKVPVYTECVENFLDAHFAHMFSMFKLVEDPTSSIEMRPFWMQMVRQWNQLAGIAAGVADFTGRTDVTAKTVYMKNFNMGAVTEHCALLAYRRQFGREPPLSPEPLAPREAPDAKSSFPHFDQGLHCSAFVKVLPDKSDVVFSHDTWNTWTSSMGARVFKVFSLNEQNTVTMSSYWAALSSIDDWYSVANVPRDFRFAVFETTNDVFNKSLFAATFPQNNSEFMRIMVSVYVGTDGKSWSQLFSYSSSGQYANSWSMAMLSAFTPGMDVPNDFLTLCVSIPGETPCADMSWYLRKTSLWKSFNIVNTITPEFQRVNALSGYVEYVKKQGWFWSWEHYARSTIFSRNSSDVRDWAGAQRLARYNNFQYDELSIFPNCSENGATGGVCSPKHSPMLAIASRGDLCTLFPTKEENIAHFSSLYMWFCQPCMGASDSKQTTALSSKSLTARIINGPTNDQQPTFDWSGNCGGKPPTPTTPSVFDFPWVEITPAFDGF